ncbi:MAG: hypothetical protein ACRDHL_09915 [Candidatus Promineifilaceae bacterium]
MRFLIHEQPGERPLAGGSFRYEQDGRPTGAWEHWRLSELAGGYSFLRLDLDERQTPSGRSLLGHAMLSPAGGTVERLKLSLFGPQVEIIADVQTGREGVTLHQQVNGRPSLDAFEADQVWLESALGLWLLALAPTVAGEALVGLLLVAGRDYFHLQAGPATVAPLGEELLTIAGREVACQLILAVFESREYRLWLDVDGLPAAAGLPDGRMAVETRRLRYGALAPLPWQAPRSVK